MKPKSVFEQGLELGGQKSHFGGQLHSLLAVELEVGCELRAKENDGLGAHASILGCSKRKHVYANIAGGLAQVETEGRGRVGDAGSVNIEKQTALVGETR